MPEQEAWRPAQVQAVLARQASGRRQRRPILLPWPGNRVFGGRLWCGVLREQRASGVIIGLAEFGVGVGAHATPTSRPRLLSVAEVRD